MLIVFSFIFTIVSHPIKPAVAITEPTKPTLESAQKMLQSQNGFFTENKGQWDPEIFFIGDTSFGKVAFTKDAIYYQMIKVTEKEIDENKPNSMDLSVNDPTNQERTFQSQTIKLSFVNPQTPTIQGSEVLTHYNNYFIGNDPKKWASNCRNFAKVTYQDVWKGIDLAYFFTSEGMKYEYYVEPTADIQDLQIKVDGAELTNQGSYLQISTTLGYLQDANLKVFDQITSATITSSFTIQNNIFSFKGIPEKRENTIVIDPLVYSTYLGGSDTDLTYGIVVDSQGDVYIAGFTWSADFPVTQNAIQKQNVFIDIFITKLNSNGTSLLYSTYLGGTKTDEAYDIAIDSQGNAYITGLTQSSDFPITSGAYQTSKKGGMNYYDIFITKLNSTGSSLLYSTYLGGTNDDYAFGIVVDSQGNAYVTGYTKSTDFPTTSGAYQVTNNGGISYYDAYITKLNSTGTSLLYSTYLGGTNDEEAFDIAVDSQGNAYITGLTHSTDFPITLNAIQIHFNSGFGLDAFITKLNSTGTSLLYSTYLGGTDDDYACDIVIDSQGNAYITGLTQSSDFPITSGAYQTSKKGGYDAFVSKINPNGTSLIYSTYLGGSSEEGGHDGNNILNFGISIDSQGNVYVAGTTMSTDFPTTLGAFQTSKKGGSDAFVSKINTNGTSLLYSTYLGGSSYESIDGIVTDSQGNAYITGTTSSTDLPTTLGAFQTSKKGLKDAFVSKLNLGTEILPPSAPPNPNGVRIDPTTVRITWQASTQGTNPIAKYRIYRSLTNQFSASVQKAEITNLLSLTWDDTNADIGTNFYYWITAFDNASPPNESTPSAMITVLKNNITKPKPPTNVKSTRIDENNIRVAWDKAIQGTYPIQFHQVYIKVDGSFLPGFPKKYLDNLEDTYSEVIANSSTNQIAIWITAIDDHGNESDDSNKVFQNVLPTIFVHGWQALKEDTRYDETEYFADMIYNFVKQHNPYDSFISPGLIQNQLQNDLVLVQCPFKINKPKETDQWVIYRYKYDDSMGSYYVSNYNLNLPGNRPIIVSRFFFPKPKPSLPPNPTKDHILVYSLRLKYEIEKIKEQENVEKVNIIAHSMGGLVSRGFIEFDKFVNTQYLNGYLDDKLRNIQQKSLKVLYGQNFVDEFVDKFKIKKLYIGDPPVNKLIMLGTPNHGAMNRFVFDAKEPIDKWIAEIPIMTYPSTLDMHPSSNFLNILNYKVDFYGNNDDFEDIITTNVPYYTIAGQFPNVDSLHYVWTHFPNYDEIQDHFTPNTRKLSVRTAFDDGFIHADSVKIDGVPFYPILFTDHHLMKEDEQPCNLTFDLLYSLFDVNNFKFDSYWNLNRFDINDPSNQYALIGIVASPVQLNMINSYGQETGVSNGVMQHEIPDSYIDILNESVTVFSDSKDSFNGFYFDVAGDESLGSQKGHYGFSMLLNNFESNQTTILSNLTPNNQATSSLLFSTTNQSTQVNQVDVYQLNWNDYLSHVPYQMNIMKDYTGDGVFDESFQTPFSPATLNGIVDYNLIHLNWTHSKPGTYPIKGYQVYRSLDNLTFSLIGETTANTFTDSTGFLGKSYYYYVLAVDIMKNPSPPSQVILVGPVTELPKPDLYLSIEMNKAEFQYGEDVLYKVEIFNKGNGEAFDTVLIVTLPDEIQYDKTDKYFGEVQPNGQVIFHIGTISRRDKVIFQINAVVAIKIVQDRSVSTIFELKAKDVDLMRKILNSILQPKKSGDPGSGSNISIQFLNTKTDPETGERYIDQASELEMELAIGGFTSPCDIKINWGDGVIDTISKTKETSMLCKHKFTSKGTMIIQITITDATGNTKTVTAKLKVR